MPDSRSFTIRTLGILDRMRHAIRLLRPLNALMMGGGVLLGGFLSQGPATFDAAARLWWAALAAALLGAGANAMNDLLDRSADRVNRPDRPLPSGRVSIRSAIVLASLAGGSGLTIAWLNSPARGIVATAAAGLLVAYNLGLGRRAVIGNLAVAAAVGLSLVFGAVPTGLTVPVWTAVTFAVLMTWAREIVKDIEDAQGDTDAGYRTLPLVAGVPTALRMTSGLLMVVILTGPIPYLAFSFGGTYLLTMLMVLFLVFRTLMRIHAEQFDPSSVSRSLKWVMLAGMISLATFDWNVALG